MGYGLLIGLGQGLQNLGNTLEEHNKQKLAAQLEEHKMQMQLENEKALAKFKDQLDDEKAANTQTTKMPDGSYHTIVRSSLNKILSDTVATDSEQKTAEYNDKQRQAALDKEAEEIKLAQAREDSISKMVPYNQTKAQAESQEAVDRGWAAKYRATHPTNGAGKPKKPPPTPEQLTQLLSSNKDVKSYMALAKSKGLSDAKIMEVLNAAAKGALDAAGKGITDPTQSNPIERFKWLITHNGMIKPEDIGPPVLPSAPSNADPVDSDNDTEGQDDNDTY